MQIYSKQATPAKLVRLNFQDSDTFNAFFTESDIEVVQIGRGQLNGCSNIIRAAGTTAVRVKVDISIVARAYFDPNLILFMLPFSQQHNTVCNGIEMCPTTLVRLTGNEGYITRGSGRDLIAVALPRQRFHETLAALQGVEPDKVDLSNRQLRLPAATLDKIRLGIAHQLNKAVATEDETAADLTTALLQAHLWAAPDAKQQRHHPCNPTRLVRLAEDRFAAGGYQRVSLADLCQAANVSAATLYRAFQSVCGMSPLSYFRMRQLNKARTTLLDTSYKRAAIKRAALDAGLAELGRFSVEYRRLFAESPSATLTRSRFGDC